MSADVLRGRSDTSAENPTRPQVRVVGLSELPSDTRSMCNPRCKNAFPYHSGHQHTAGRARGKASSSARHRVQGACCSTHPTLALGPYVHTLAYRQAHYRQRTHTPNSLYLHSTMLERCHDYADLNGLVRLPWGQDQPFSSGRDQCKVLCCSTHLILALSPSHVVHTPSPRQAQYRQLSGIVCKWH